MELVILDHEYRDLYIIDGYESLIWTERYYTPGDFEIYTPVNDYILGAFKLIIENLNNKLDVFVWSEDSDTIMCVDTAQIKTDLEVGPRIILSGPSVASILDRRIIWSQTILRGNLEDAIEKILNENVISPAIEDRKMPNVIFVRSEDPRVKALKIEMQVTGDNLLEFLEKICKQYSIGFNMQLNGTNLEFSLYMGADRSYEQEENPEVIFSAEFDNLLNTDYLESVTNYRNVALIAGEDRAQNRKTRVVGSASGMQRRELYVDARDIQSVNDAGEDIPMDQYNAQLDQRGQEDLTEYTYIKSFEGEIEPHQSFIYGRDFFKGDIVQLENEYGIEGRVRILEIIRSFDDSGYKVYPTFEVLEEEGRDQNANNSL